MCVYTSGNQGRWRVLLKCIAQRITPVWRIEGKDRVVRGLATYQTQSASDKDSFSVNRFPLLTRPKLIRYAGPSRTTYPDQAKGKGKVVRGLATYQTQSGSEKDFFSANRFPLLTRPKLIRYAGPSRTTYPDQAKSSSQV